MSSVDNKVVSLTFDNASFQKRAGDTMSTQGQAEASSELLWKRKSLGDLQQWPEIQHGLDGTTIEE